ncbi:MAG: hypothetical protein IPJ40_08030 [Saprospirales bacterium]|nr:hypothetical protein [Saprospirales bacterium]
MVDQTSPEISCLPDVTTAKTSDDGTGNCATTVALDTPFAIDHGSGATMIAQVGGVTIDPLTYLFEVGTTEVTWTVTDVAGLSALYPE